MTKIQILGIKGHCETEFLRTNTIRAIEELGLKIRLEEVNDIEQLMESHIMGIPAIAIDGEIISEYSVPGVEDLKKLIKDMIPVEKNALSKHNHLLVPTDYSEAAHAALNYAIAMAQRCGIGIELIHYYRPVPEVVQTALEVQRTKNSSAPYEFMETFVKENIVKYQRDASLLPKITPRWETGFAASGIIDRSRNKKSALIVMGTSGKSNHVERWMGSVSTKVAKEAHCPVLLVPPTAQFKGIKKVLFASNHPVEDKLLVQQLEKFLKVFNAEIHFLHIQENPYNGYKVIEEKEENQLLPQVFRTITVESKNVLTGINRYAREKDIDLVVMVTGKRPFLQEILHKSVSKRMIFNTKIPILILHL